MFLPDPCSVRSIAPNRRSRVASRRPVMAVLAALGVVGIVVGIVVGSATAADAHVKAAPAQITAGAAAAIQLTVEEGCGTLSTIQLAVQLPPAFGTAADPVAPPGWTAEQVADVLTFRGPGLPADAPFTVSFTVTADPAVAGTTQRLPSVQRCDKQAVERWIDRVDATHPEPDHPAPVVAVLAPPPPTTTPTTVAPSTVAPSTVAPSTAAPTTTPTTTPTSAATAVAAPTTGSTTAAATTATTLVAATAPARPSDGSSGSALASVVGVVAALSAAGGFALARRRRPAAPGPAGSGPAGSEPAAPAPIEPPSPGAPTPPTQTPPAPPPTGAPTP